VGYKTPKISKKLEEYNIDVKIVDVRPWGDPGNMSHHEIKEALKESRSYSWSDKFFNKLNRTITKSTFMF